MTIESGYALPKDFLTFVILSFFGNAPKLHTRNLILLDEDARPASVMQSG